MCALFFFFQAEDGIRDLTVTGVQTCALPIWSAPSALAASSRVLTGSMTTMCPGEYSRAVITAARPIGPAPTITTVSPGRSEERRVGKECRCECMVQVQEVTKNTMVVRPDSRT